MIHPVSIIKNTFKKIQYKLFLNAVRKAYLTGDGVEIGPGSKPIAPQQNSVYCDKFDYWARKFPVVKCDADKLPFEDNSFNFLVSAHMLEHSPNPLKELREWCRVLKTGGNLIILLPHGLRTFDKGRSFTSYEHLLDDYKNNAKHGDISHKDEFFEFVPNAYKHIWLKNMSGNLDQDWNFIQEQGHVHYHVWNQSTFTEVLIKEGFSVLEVKETVPGRYDSFIVISRKT